MKKSKGKSGQALPDTNHHFVPDGLAIYNSRLKERLEEELGIKGE